MYRAAPWSISQGRPCQTRRFGFCGGPVRVGHEPIEPHDVGRERWVDDSRGVADGRIERQRPGQEVHAEVDAAAGPDEIVDLLVRFRVAERRIDVDRDEVGNREADRAPDLAREPLGDERAGSLAGASELDDVEAVVVGLDEPGERAAFSQRRHVARGHDGSHHPQSLTEPGAGGFGRPNLDFAGSRILPFLTRTGRFARYGPGR